MAFCIVLGSDSCSYTHAIWVRTSEQSLEVSVCVGLSILLWLVPYLEIKLPFTLALLYPVTILANIVVAFQSFRHTIAGNISWKDRPIAKQKWKWL